MADTKHITHQGVVWTLTPKEKRESLGLVTGYECLADSSVAVYRYPADTGIFCGWCVLVSGCGVYKSNDPNTTLDECLSYGNRYAAANCEGRLARATEEKELAEEAMKLVEHIRPLETREAAK